MIPHFNLQERIHPLAVRQLIWDTDHHKSNTRGLLEESTSSLLTNTAALGDHDPTVHFLCSTLSTVGASGYFLACDHGWGATSRPFYHCVPRHQTTASARCLHATCPHHLPQGAERARPCLERSPFWSEGTNLQLQKREASGLVTSPDPSSRMGTEESLES